MRKLLLIILVLFSLSGNSQFYNNYHYSPPTASMSINSYDASSVNITYDYQPNGCKITEIRLEIYASGYYSRSEYFPISNATSTSVTTTIYGLSGSTTYSLYLWVYNCYSVAVPASQFTTPSGTTVTPPTVSTGSGSNISYSSFTANGNVTDEGSSSVTSRGFKYWMVYEPNNVYTVSSGSGSGSFNSSISGLYTAQLYQYKAYATNSTGTSYGDVVNVQLSTPSGGVPTVVTTVATLITTGSALTGGNVTSDGNAEVTDRGVCYGTSANPTVKNQSGTGIGVYYYTMSYLSPSTLYYYRAYATNSYGTSYGSEYSFTTASVSSTPTVTTTAISSIGTTTATGGGNVTSDGGSTITARGIVISTTAGVNLSNSQKTIVDGSSSTGSYSSSITGLSCNMNYYVNAYATNINGTSYGTETNFTTSSVSTTKLQWVQYVINSSGTTIYVTSEATAISACSAYPTNLGFGRTNFSAVNVNVGSLLYNYGSCTTATRDGWAFAMFGNSSPYSYYVIHFTGGVITSSAVCP